MQRLIQLSSTALLVAAAACGGADSAHGPADNRSSVPENFYLAEAPGGAVDVAAACASAADGDPIVVRGTVGGSEKPFVEGLAAFTLVDPALKSCLGDGMDCETPWDYCCVDPRTMAKSSATIELVVDGRLLAADARHFHGLDHLVTVLVQGTAKRDSQGNLTVLATGLHPLP